MSPKPIGLNTIDIGLTDSAAVTVVAMWMASGDLTSMAVFLYASGISTGNSPKSTASMSRYSSSRSLNWCCRSWASSSVARSMASSSEDLEFLNQPAGGALDMLMASHCAPWVGWCPREPAAGAHRPAAHSALAGRRRARIPARWGRPVARTGDRVGSLLGQEGDLVDRHPGTT